MIGTYHLQSVRETNRNNNKLILYTANCFTANCYEHKNMFILKLAYIYSRNKIALHYNICNQEADS